MGNISFKAFEGDFLIQVDQKVLEQNSFFELAKMIRLKYLAYKANLDDQTANELAELVNNSWWERNGEALIQEINK